MPLYLIRHGESEGNARRVFQGTLDMPLTALGETQAQTLGRWLHAHGVRPRRIYSSPLLRAQRTAQLVAAAFQGAAGSGVPVELAPELREYAGGQLEGLSEEQQELRFPGVLTRPLSVRGDFSQFGGESYAQIQARLSQFVDGLDREQLQHEDLLAVAHGGSLYQLLKLLCGAPVPRHFQVHISNCCCFKLQPRWFPEGLLMHMQWMIPLELIESSLALPPQTSDDPGLE